MNPRITAAAIAACLTLSSGCSIIEATALTEEEQAQADAERQAKDDAEQSSDDASDGAESSADSETGDGPDGQASPPPKAPQVPELPEPIWAEMPLALEPIAELTEPTAATLRSGFLHLYVGERSGVVRIIERSFTKAGSERISLSRRIALDLSEEVSVEGEGGLLGLAFSSDGRYLFVSYTNLDGDVVVAEYTAGRSTRADASTRRVLLTIPQPFANHNGGQLTLGNDGYLYIGVGDGGGSYDPDGNAQDRTTLLGSILRIDTFATGGYEYGIPAGNPFVGQDEFRQEIYLYGVRNPWRFSFDQATGDLWVADVGQDTSEEINFLAASQGAGSAANLGWPDVEGYVSVDGAGAPEGYQAPIHVYDSDGDRCSVIGGFVYRGTLVPALDGAYIFGDYCSGEIFGLLREDDVANVWPLQVSVEPNQLASFAQGDDGEIYVLQLNGQVTRLEMGEVPEDE